MNQLQTVLDALETAFDTSWAQEIPLMESAIAIVRQMMQAEPVAFLDKYGEIFNEVEKLLPTDTPLYAAPQAVPAWLPIESAPKDGEVIIGYCVHTADPYYAGERLTDYGARCEGLGHVEDGIHAIMWESAREDSDGWESQSYLIPAGWVHNADCEQMANPTHWMPLPAAPKGAV